MSKKSFWKKVLKKMYKHPYITLGATVVPAIAFSAITGAANKVHDTYDIASQHGQKKILKEQLDVLKEIAKKGKIEKVNVNSKADSADRASYYTPDKLVLKRKRYY